MSITRGDGRKVVTTAGTAEAVGTAITGGISEVIVTAETDNTGVIVVGGSTVVAALATRRGTPLLSGESIVMKVHNISEVYIDATVTGDGVTYQYVNEDVH
jgi:hypothetical protein